jgi:Fe-S cluster assembly scaffold protein SufB
MPSIAKEKPLSEIQLVNAATHIFNLAVGEEQRISIDVSVASFIYLRATLADHSLLTVVLLGEAVGDVSIVRVVDSMGVGASIRFASAIRVCGDAKMSLDAQVQVSSSNARCEIDDRIVGDGSSRSIIRHCVVVDRAVERSVISTTIRGMILGERSSIRAIPELDIQSNTVQAKHAVTIARPRKEVFAYFASRGIPEHEAVGLIAEQFLCPLGRV